MSREILCQMANDIGNFFATEPDRETAIDGIRNHMQRFWEPRMRKQIIALVASGEEPAEPLSPLVLEAIGRLEENA